MAQTLYCLNTALQRQKQYNSARALVKKTQEPGIKLQKADFFQD